MTITHNFVTVCYTFVCTVINSDCFQAVDPHHYWNRQWMHLVRHPRGSEMSAALLSVRVGSACNVNSHSLGSVQLGQVRFGSARLGSTCSVNEPLDRYGWYFGHRFLFHAKELLVFRGTNLSPSSDGKREVLTYCGGPLEREFPSPSE